MRQAFAVILSLLIVSFPFMISSQLRDVSAATVSCQTVCPSGDYANADPSSESQRTNTTTSSHGNKVESQIYAYEGRNQSSPVRYQDGDPNHDYYLFNIWSVVIPASDFLVGYDNQLGGIGCDVGWSSNVTVSVNSGEVLLTQVEPLPGPYSQDQVQLHLGVDLEHISFGLDYTIHFGGWSADVNPSKNKVSWRLTLTPAFGGEPAHQTYLWRVGFGVIVPEGKVPDIHSVVQGRFVRGNICAGSTDDVVNTTSSGIWHGPSPDPDVHSRSPTFPQSIGLGDTATIEVSATNHGNSAPWQTIAIGFPNIVNPEDIQLVNSNIPQEQVHVYPSGTMVKGCYSACNITLQYPHFEAEWAPSISSESAYVKVNAKPETSGTFTFYVKSIASFEWLAGKAGKWDPTSCSRPFMDDQRECVYSFSFDVRPPPFSVAFYTNPSASGSIRFDNTVYQNGGTGNYPTGTYTAGANSLDLYIFYDWLPSGGVRIQSVNANPAAVDVSGPGSLTAEFSAKVTFYTLQTGGNPAPGGWVTWNPDTSECSGPSHPNEDVIYEHRLPPNYHSTFTVCASVPSGYTFSRWSSDGGVSLLSSAVVNPARVALSGPGSLTAIYSLMPPSSLPNGITTSFSYSTVSSSQSSVLTISVDSTVAPGLYTVHVNGTSGSQTHNVDITISVIPPPEFTISAPKSVSFTAGSSVALIISFSGTNGFAGPVTLSSSSPDGVSCSLEPSTVSGSQTATLNCNGNTPGTYLVVITGVGGSVTRTTTVSVTVASNRILGLDPPIFYGILVGIVALIAVGGMTMFLRRRKP